jgi:hypothetical protein
MYNGVKAMIAAEKKLAASKPKPAAGADIKAGSHLKSVADLTGFPVFPDGNKSLLCKFLTKDVYNKYKG